MSSTVEEYWLFEGGEDLDEKVKLSFDNRDYNPDWINTNCNIP